MAITYGYIRVSTADQNEARQIDAMALADVDRANVVIDKQSGKDFNRPSWKRLKRKIRKGDLIIVQSLDRLGRNYTEVIEEWRNIALARHAPRILFPTGNRMERMGSSAGLCRTVRCSTANYTPIHRSFVPILRMKTRPSLQPSLRITRKSTASKRGYPEERPSTAKTRKHLPELRGELVRKAATRKKP